MRCRVAAAAISKLRGHHDHVDRQDSESAQAEYCHGRSLVPMVSISCMEIRMLKVILQHLELLPTWLRTMLVYASGLWLIDCARWSCPRRGALRKRKRSAGRARRRLRVISPWRGRSAWNGFFWSTSPCANTAAERWRSSRASRIGPPFERYWRMSNPPHRRRASYRRRAVPRAARPICSGHNSHPTLTSHPLGWASEGIGRFAPARFSAGELLNRLSRANQRPKRGSPQRFGVWGLDQFRWAPPGTSTSRFNAEHF